MENIVVEVTLPGGATALVRANRVDGGATKAGWADSFDFDGVVRTLEGVSAAIRSGLVKAAPDKATVELGLELVIKAGKLTGLLVDGQGKGALTVTLEWQLAQAAKTPEL